MAPRVQPNRILMLRRILPWAARVVGAGLAVLLCICGYFWLSTELPAPEHLRARAALGSTRILDRRGQLLYSAPDPFSGQRHILSFDEIPPALQQATIDVEDRDFRHNAGVDFNGILRAAWLDLRSG